MMTGWPPFGAMLTARDTALQGLRRHKALQRVSNLLSKLNPIELSLMGDQVFDATGVCDPCLCISARDIGKRFCVWGFGTCPVGTNHANTGGSTAKYKNLTMVALSSTAQCCKKQPTVFESQALMLLPCHVCMHMYQGSTRLLP
jgi:hypothetical protein